MLKVARNDKNSDWQTTSLTHVRRCTLPHDRCANKNGQSYTAKSVFCGFALLCFTLLVIITAWKTEAVMLDHKVQEKRTDLDESRQ